MPFWIFTNFIQRIFLYFYKGDNQHFTALQTIREQQDTLNRVWTSLLLTRSSTTLAIATLIDVKDADQTVIDANVKLALKTGGASLKNVEKYWKSYLEQTDRIGNHSPALEQNYKTIHNALIELTEFIQERDITSAYKQPTQSYLDNLSAEYDRYVEQNDQKYQAALDEANRSYHTTYWVTLGVLLVLLAISVSVWKGLRTILLVPLNKTIEGIRLIAAGNLDSEVEVYGSNEMGQLADALRHMQAELSRTVGDVRIGADSILRGTSEISEGNHNLSIRIVQQATALEQTAASMMELTATVKQNAENASQASQLALNASETARCGGKVVDDVVQTMAGIADSSRKIADITNVINSIAFQTNILALNAAVEAARAGEQGRGFAVVASEVRNLAQRSAGAAKEIQVLIDDSVTKVNSGSTLVGSAGETMDEIVQAVARVTDIMTEIASASDEQSRGIDQVGIAITEMDRVTQQNAQLVKESAVAAVALEEQASRLNQAVAVFHIQQESDNDTFNVDSQKRP